VDRDDRFDRDGDDVVSEVPISFFQAALGGEVEIDTIDDRCQGTTILELRPGTQSGDEIVRQGQAESRYRWGPPARRVGVRFCVGGEAHLPAALASMVAKYLRELIMRAFNAFWSTHVPGIRPTAGYFNDARRFKDEIEPTQRKLGIEDRHLWRCC
ncbi:MAG: DnaJ C-terminal domain-containing protein, partial [Pirellulales bacterium]